MITRHAFPNVTWVDLEAPTREELHSVMQEFGVPARLESEIENPTPYPLSIAFTDLAYLILHFPTAELPGEGARNQEIDFIVGKHFLITARYEVITSIHNLHEVFEAEALLDRPERSIITTEVLLERISRRLYQAIREEVERTSLTLDRIERDIFSGKERETVRSISDVGRVLLRFETTLRRHEEPLDSFLMELRKSSFFGTSFGHHASSIVAEHDHVASLVASFRDVAQELRTTNDSLLSASQNEVMKNFTFMALMTFPLTLIAAILTVPAEHPAPLIGLPFDFWIMIGLMLIVAFGLYSYARLKRWI